MALSDDEIIAKILTRFPNFKDEESVNEVRKAIKWVCNDGYATSIVKEVGNRESYLAIDELSCAIKCTHIVTGYMIYGDTPFEKRFREEYAIKFYKKSLGVRQVLDFIEYAKGGGYKAAYEGVNDIADAEEYIKIAIGTDISRIDLDSTEYVINVGFKYPVVTYLNWIAGEESDVRDHVHMVMLFYNYFYAEAQDVKVARD